MPHQNQHQRNRNRPHQILVVGVLHVRSRAGRDVRPGGVRRQPHGRRPERRRHLLEDIHDGRWERGEGGGVVFLYAGVVVLLKVFNNSN